MAVSDFPIFGSGWNSRLRDELSRPYMQSLLAFVDGEYNSSQVVFPPRHRVFRALHDIDFADVRVVILGQDPYHDEGQANGFAFAVENGVKAPPSLANIFKEIVADLNVEKPVDTSLVGWAEQGVMLLNTVLTVRAHEAFSHRGRGWEEFSHKVITELNEHERPIVFMLWGAPAQKNASMITNPKHLILKAPHPSPLSAYRGFLGCGHFSKANEFLRANGLTPIDWSRTGCGT
jgi:uracil-DNA glycosylase